MHRRTLVAALAGLPLLAAGSRRPAPQGPLGSFGELVDASSSVFDDLGGLIEIAAQEDAFDEAERADLTTLLRQLELVTSAKSLLVSSLDRYLAAAPTATASEAATDWRRTLNEIEGLYALVEQTRHIATTSTVLRGQVGQAPLQQLSRLMDARITVLDQLRALEAPRSEAEIGELVELRARYGRLIASMETLKLRLYSALSA